MTTDIIHVYVEDCVPNIIEMASDSGISAISTTANVIERISGKIPGWDAVLTIGSCPEVLFTFEPTIKELSEIAAHWAVLLKRCRDDWNPHNHKGDSRMELLGINDALTDAMSVLNKLSEVTDL